MRFYNKRGMAEQWIKEGNQAVKMTRLSCHRFHSNQVDSRWGRWDPCPKPCAQPKKK